MLNKWGVRGLSKTTFHRLIRFLQWCHIVDVERDEFDRRRRYIVLRSGDVDIFYPKFVVDLFTRFCGPWRIFRYYLGKGKPFYGLMFAGPYRLILGIFDMIRDEFEIALGRMAFLDVTETGDLESVDKSYVVMGDDYVDVGINAACAIFRHTVETLCSHPDVSWFIWLYLRLLYRSVFSRHRNRFILSDILLEGKLKPTRRKEHLVTPGEVRVLGFLMRVGVALWRDLFRRLGMSKSSLSYVLNRLEAGGVVELEEEKGRKIYRIILDGYHDFIIRRLRRKLKNLGKRRDEKERIKYIVMWVVEALLHIFLVSMIMTLERCGVSGGRMELLGDMTLNELLQVLQRYDRARQKSIEAIIDNMSRKFYDSLREIANIVLVRSGSRNSLSRLKEYLSGFLDLFVIPTMKS